VELIVNGIAVDKVALVADDKPSKIKFKTQVERSSWVALRQPDIILVGGGLATRALQRETRTIPIVFVGLGDPVASGLVPRLNQLGGNITGFALLEPTLGGKWLELLSEIAPGLKRAAFMFNPDTALASAFMPSLETAARSSGASREAALSSWWMHSPLRIACRSCRSAARRRRGRLPRGRSNRSGCGAGKQSV
jgi:ABC-type uncharacterized transport system substrate-binding protein